jgi:hypothetical protein
VEVAVALVLLEQQPLLHLLGLEVLVDQDWLTLSLVYQRHMQVEEVELMMLEVQEFLAQEDQGVEEMLGLEIV